MLAALVDQPFDDENWIFEIKWDGYRAIAELDNGKVNLYSRNNNSFNQKYKPIVSALESIDTDMVLDGEIVVLDEEGRSDFHSLQNFGKSGKGRLIYYVFDLLYFDGRDLRGLSLYERKQILKNILPDIPAVRYNDHIIKDGTVFYKLAGEKQLEGIIAKNINSKYQSNKRSKDWLKIKLKKRQEAVIGGYTKPKGSRNYFGALVLGVYNDNNELEYIGHAKLVNNKLPGITSVERSPSKRKHKVYLDYLQNRKGQTLAAPYSVRPRPGAPVATPLEWSEVKTGLKPSDYHIKNIFRRLGQKGDIFQKILADGIDIQKCLENLRD